MIPEERRQLIIDKYLEGIERKKISAYFSMPYATVQRIIQEYEQGHERVVYHRTCEWCGVKFDSYNKRKRCCSQNHAHFVWMKKHHVRYKVCPVCNKNFKVSDEHKKYCSDECCNMKYKNNAQIEERTEKVKSTHHSISEMAAEARKLGMSYGEYVRHING